MSGFALIVLPVVWRDLEDIGRDIERDSPARAASFTAEIIAKLQMLAMRPLSYRLRLDLSPGIRVGRHAPYLILFEFDGEAVTIVRVLHERRNLDKALRRG